MTASALTRPGQRDRVSMKLPEIDWRLAFALAAICGIGSMMLYSAAGQHWQPWAAKHVSVFSVCFVAMLALSLLNLRVWFVLAYPTYAAGVLLCAAVLVVGHHALGAQRWIRAGPLQLQPSEIVKIGLVLALARFYHGLPAGAAKWSWRLLIPAGLIAVPVLLVLKQPDLGTAILIASTGLAVMFCAGLTWKVLAAGALGAAVAAPAAVTFLLHGYQRERIMTFLNPGDDPSGSGYHILQAETALGSGGLLGKGFGLGS